jgi:indolepyruvate ferredoxin oxidoreductase
MERQLIKDFESLVARMLHAYQPAQLGLWRELLSLPLNIRGFGPVKLANAQAMQKRRAELLAQLTSRPDTERSAA